MSCFLTAINLGQRVDTAAHWIRRRMRRLATALMQWLVCLLLASTALAESVINADSDQLIAPLLPHLHYWVPDQPIDIGVASDPANRDRFQPVAGTAIAAIGREVWYRFSVRASAPYAQRLIVAFEQTKYQELDFYTPSGDGWEVSSSGLARPYHQRPLDYRFIAAPLSVTPDQTVDIYFRLLSLRGIAVAPLLELDTVFFTESIRYSVLSGIITGSLAALLIYIALISRLTLRNSQLVWLLGFIAVCLFSTLYYDGYFADNLETSVKLTEIIPFLIPALLNITALLFCRNLFDTAQKMPIIHRLISVPVIGYIALVIAVGILPTSSVPPQIPRVLTLLSLFLLLAISLRAIMLRISGCYYYAIGMLFYISGGVIITLSAIGFWSLPATGRLFLSASAVAQTLFFSVAALQVLASMRNREQQLEKAALEANTRAAVQSGFLVTMSHEIRTPINGVIGMTQMLEKTPLDSNQRYYLDILNNAGKTLLSVINEILDLSKIEAGKLDIESIYFDANHTVLCVASLFGEASQQKGIRFNFSTDPRLPLHLIGDPVRLEQILNNLLSNAGKFTDSGEISLHIGLVEKTGDDAVTIRFSVKDTGIGISEQALAKLFTPFSQAETSTSRRYGGSGLGLAICKRLVELMGGSIHATSTPGAGSTFWVDLPFRIAKTEQTLFEKNIARLRGLQIGWCLQSPQYVEDYCNALQYWGAHNRFFHPDENAASVDWNTLDILIVSNVLQQHQLSHWINFAKQHDCAILLLEGYSVSGIDSSDPLINSVLHLPRPAGYTRLVEYLLKALADEKNPLTKNKAATDSNDSPAAGLSLLVAEDNPVNIKVLEALFGKYAINAQFVGNGQLAVEAFCSSPDHYDAILMDCDMPVMNGFDATRQIRQLEQKQQLQAITIIALTAHALHDTHEQCIASGMNEILTKPINFPALLSVLGKVPRRLTKPA